MTSDLPAQPEEAEILLYQTEDRQSRLEVSFSGETSWQNKRKRLMLMKSKTKSQTNELVQAIGELAGAHQQLTHQARQQYSFEVDTILRDQCREPRRIECLLDGMLDFCFDDDMLRLYKKLCRYYFKMDPVATTSYVYAYREMWDEKGGSMK